MAPAQSLPNRAAQRISLPQRQLSLPEPNTSYTTSPPGTQNERKSREVFKRIEGRLRNKLRKISQTAETVVADPLASELTLTEDWSWQASDTSTVVTPPPGHVDSNFDNLDFDTALFEDWPWLASSTPTVMTPPPVHENIGFGVIPLGGWPPADLMLPPRKLRQSRIFACFSTDRSESRFRSFFPRRVPGTAQHVLDNIDFTVGPTRARVRYLDYTYMNKRCRYSREDCPHGYASHSKHNQTPNICSFSEEIMRRTNRDFGSKKRVRSSRTWNLQNFEGFVAEDVCVGDHSSEALLAKQDYRRADAFGRASLSAWKHTAGRGKSWNRCAIVTAPSPSQHIHVVVIPGEIITAIPRSESHCIKDRSHIPCTTRNQVFMRILRTLQRPVPSRSGRQKKFLRHMECNDDFDQNFEIEEGFDYAGEMTKEVRSHLTHEDAHKKPHAFRRLILDTRMVGLVEDREERFYPYGIVLGHTWRMGRFLRNDSHADVYATFSTHIEYSSSVPESNFEAHIFLYEYRGNSAAYARRHKGRMRKGSHCVRTFWHDGRHVFIMFVPAPSSIFTFHNTEEEYPSLVTKKTWVGLMGKRQRPSRELRTYAKVTQGSQPQQQAAGASVHNHLPNMESTQENVREDLRQSSSARSRKQKNKRRVQRTARKPKVAET
jgi:hypothetical protein